MAQQGSSTRDDDADDLDIELKAVRRKSTGCLPGWLIVIGALVVLAVAAWYGFFKPQYEKQKAERARMAEYAAELGQMQLSVAAAQKDVSADGVKEGLDALQDVAERLNLLANRASQSGDLAFASETAKKKQEVTAAIDKLRSQYGVFKAGAVADIERMKATVGGTVPPATQEGTGTSGGGRNAVAPGQ